MKKIITVVFTAIFVTVMLCGCGSKSEPNGYRFSQAELSNIIGMSKEELDSLTEKPASVTPGEIYLYQLPRSASPDKVDNIMLSVLNGHGVIGVFITTDIVSQNGAKSDHAVCGIHVGDSKSSADAAGLAYGSATTSTADYISEIVPEFSALSSYLDIACYGDPSTNKGLLTVVCNKATEEVMMVGLTTK